MDRQELYINGARVDLPQGFTVRINRALINPAELNTKDAQFSYSITLPNTPTNAEIFNRSNIEETKNKFNREYRAQYIASGVRIFDGMFRMSGIGAAGFKGNLYLPDRKSIKDIFGDLGLRDNAPMLIPFTDFVPSINGYNIAAETAPQPAIFPYVLYGVLPKVPLNKDANSYSPRTVWDGSVRIGMQDLPPSINVMMMLRHIFESQGYALQGSAFDDDRLTRLYMSYRNASDYVQPWNYGQHAKVHLRGEWSTRYNKRTGLEVYERGINQGQGSGGGIYGTDFLDATNTKIEVLEDKGGNVLYQEVNDGDNVTWVRGQIRIPVSGFYKVRFGASLHVFDWQNFRHTDAATGVQHIGGRTENASNWMQDNPYEIRLCRDWGKGADFGLGSPKLNGLFYYNNQPQNETFDADNAPKYFPQTGVNGQTNFVDLAQDRGHLLGFSFGKHEARDAYVNPQDSANRYAQVLAAKPAQSWEAASTTDTPTRLAIQSAGWWKYGRIGSFDTEGENPNTNVDFSDGAFMEGNELDANGGAVPVSNFDYTILHRFPVQRYFTYILTAPEDYEATVFLHNGIDPVPVAKVDFIQGEARIDTSAEWLNTFTPYITLYVRTPQMDVRDTLNISRIIGPATEDVIGWELTNKYAIALQQAPTTYARRAQYNGQAADGNWYGQGDASAVVWLNAGEMLTVASVSSEGRYRRDGMHSTFGLVSHEINFELSVEPFRTDPEWLKVSLGGNGTGTMNWNDAPNFTTDTIDLVQFLYGDMKTDEFIDNFVKAFNLKLSQLDARTFALDLKQTRQSVSSLSVDLDAVASVNMRENSPLGLPSLYKIGFTINTEEQGFAESGDDGGGTFSTGAIEENIVEQKSTFSYNWYKDIQQGGVALKLPIISKSDVWDALMAYPEAMTKRYTDLPYRFWYFDGQLNDSGASFEFNNDLLVLAQVSNEMEGVNILNYKNARFTLLDNYFTVLINGASHYTEIEAYITPQMYAALNGAMLAKFNGDMYYIAELSGYDPTGRNKTKLKLIRRI